MVQPTQYTGGNAASDLAPRDPWDVLEGGGGPPALKFGHRNQFQQFIPAEIGTSYTGVLAEDLTSAVITNYETGEVEIWQNTGRPKEQIIAVLQTDYRDDAEDNGLRRLFFKGQMLTALQTEMREKKTGRVGPGTRFTVTLVDLKAPTQAGFNPQNIFRVDLGPEIVPWVSESQRAVDTTLGIEQAAAAGFPPQATVPGAPQVQVVQPPAQPAAPAAAPAAPAQDPAVAAAIAAAQQPTAPAQPVSLVSDVDVNAIRTIVSAGIARDMAIANYAAQKGLGPDFVAALTAATETVGQ